MGALMWGWARLIVPKRPGMQLAPDRPTSSMAQTGDLWVEPAEVGAARLSQGTLTASSC